MRLDRRGCRTSLRDARARTSSSSIGLRDRAVDSAMRSSTSTRQLAGDQRVGKAQAADRRDRSAAPDAISSTSRKPFVTSNAGDRSPVALDHRIRHQRRAVDDRADTSVESTCACSRMSAAAFDHRKRGIVRRGELLVDRERAGSSSSSAKSVNVPPISTPMRKLIRATSFLRFDSAFLTNAPGGRGGLEATNLRRKRRP